MCVGNKSKISFIYLHTLQICTVQLIKVDSGTFVNQWTVRDYTYIEYTCSVTPGLSGF